MSLFLPQLGRRRIFWVRAESLKVLIECTQVPYMPAVQRYGSTAIPFFRTAPQSTEVSQEMNTIINSTAVMWYQILGRVHRWSSCAEWLFADWLCTIDMLTLRYCPPEKPLINTLHDAIHNPYTRDSSIMRSLPSLAWILFSISQQQTCI